MFNAVKLKAIESLISQYEYQIISISIEAGYGENIKDEDLKKMTEMLADARLKLKILTSVKSDILKEQEEKLLAKS